MACIVSRSLLLWLPDSISPPNLFSSRAYRRLRTLTVPKNSYLLRPELITLHEAETTFLANPIRGAQLYMACIQIRVTGEGSVSLPSGVGFPGAYE